MTTQPNMTDHAKFKAVLMEKMGGKLEKIVLANQELMETKDKRIKELEAKLEGMWEDLQNAWQRTKLAQQEISSLNREIYVLMNGNINDILERWHSG